MPTQPLQEVPWHLPTPTSGSCSLPPPGATHPGSEASIQARGRRGSAQAWGEGSAVLPQVPAVGWKKRASSGWRQRTDPNAPLWVLRSRTTGRCRAESGGRTNPGSRRSRHARSCFALPQRPPPANRLARGLVGLRAFRPRRPPAPARVRTTLPRKPRKSACLLGVVVQRGASEREAGGRRNYISHDAARRPRGPGV